MKVFLSAGEASGDNLGAALARELKLQHPNVELVGIGGDKMRAAGVRTMYDVTDLSVMGVTEVILKLPQLYRIRKTISKHLAADKPDVFVAIDYPEFNANIAGIAKKLGIKTLCYKAPSIWAWGEWRVHKVKRNYDFVAAIFPFEAAAYAKHHVSSAYVGNPIVENIANSDCSVDVKAKYGIDSEAQVVLLLPGSRRNEIERLLPVLLEAARLLEYQGAYRFVLPLASTIKRGQIDSIISRHALKRELILAEGKDVYSWMTNSIMALATSGTVTLECTLLSLPVVIAYRTSRVMYFLARIFAKAKYIGLPNIVLDRKLFPEFIQGQCTAENISSAALNILRSERIHVELQAGFDEIDSLLRSRAVAEHVARQVLALGMEGSVDGNL